MNKPVRLQDIPFEETLPEEPAVPPIRNIFASDSALRKDAHLHWFHHVGDGLFNRIFHSILKKLPSRLVSDFGRAIVPLVRFSYRKKIFPKRIERNFSALSAGRWKDEDSNTSGLDRWWYNIGRTMSEFSAVNRVWSENRVEIEGIENLEAARQLGGPLIFCSTHLSTWEALGVAIHLGVAGPTIGMFEPESNRFKNRLIHEIRKERLHYVFPPGQRSALRLHKLMKAGQCSILVFIDEVRNKQVHMPLFGRKLPDKGNAAIAVKLANSSKGTLVPTYLTRTGSAQFKMVVLPPIQRPEGPGAYGLTDTLATLNDIFEPIVLKHIEEWYMLGELRLPENFEQGAYAKSLACKNAVTT